MEGITYHDEPEGVDMMSNFWLSTIVLNEELRIKNEESAYSQPVRGAVGGAAGMVHSGGPVHTDCEPNRHVEALRMALDEAGIESRPLWKPMLLRMSTVSARISSTEGFAFPQAPWSPMMMWISLSGPSSPLSSK